MQALIENLYEIGAVRFGTFTLKSQIISPFYLDLRLVISFPRLLSQIGEMMKIAAQDMAYDLICGVPYTALPFATLLSLHQEIPMILKRKEQKRYGTGKLIEGMFRKGEKCLILEDVVTSGQSILETIEALEGEDIIVKDIVVLVDREQGGKKLIEQKGYRLHSIFTISRVAEILLNSGKIDHGTFSTISSYISSQK